MTSTDLDSPGVGPRRSVPLPGWLDYRFGFSVLGLLAFVVQELPYLPWLLWPPADDPLAGNTAATFWLGLLESVGGVLTVVVLVVLLPRDGVRPRPGGPWFAGAVACLGVYFACWVAYFAGVTSGWLLVLGLSAPVPVYYLCTGMWLRNRYTIVTCALFFVGHVGSNALNYLW